MNSYYLNLVISNLLNLLYCKTFTITIFFNQNLNLMSIDDSTYFRKSSFKKMDLFIEQMYSSHGEFFLFPIED